MCFNIYRSAEIFNRIHIALYRGKLPVQWHSGIDNPGIFSSLSSDSFTESTSPSWFGRIGNAFIRKIISGGQTGADRAALDAAIAMGVPYGGWYSFIPSPEAFSSLHCKSFLPLANCQMIDWKK